MGSTSWSSKCEVVHLSLDINELVRAVKQAAVEAVKADGPMAVSFGTVTSASPLKIQVDQKKTLTEAQLILTYKGRKTFKVHLALKAGEKVILISCDGGQKYIVLDRWEAP